jgi:hypothetical protein
MVVQENKEEKKIMVTNSLLQLANELDSEEGYKAPNLLQRLFSLFKNVRLGSDITHFQVVSLVQSLYKFFFDSDLVLLF